jgi:hypothetical protein
MATRKAPAFAKNAKGWATRLLSGAGDELFVDG